MQDINTDKALNQEKEDKKDLSYKTQNRLWINMDLLSTENPRQHNKYIFILMLICIIGMILYVFSFYW